MSDETLNWLLFALAALSLIFIPFTPQLLRLRIRFFRWIHWNWAANLLENSFQGWVLFVRVFLLLLAIVLLYFGWRVLT